MLPDKYMIIKLNQDTIDEIMEWYESTFDQRIIRDSTLTWYDGQGRTGQKYTQQEMETEMAKVRKILEDVPAIYLEFIDQVLLSNDKTPYDDLPLNSKKHPAHHIATSQRLFEREEENDYSKPKTGVATFDKIMHMRVTGQYADEVFASMTRGALDLVKAERAINYCRNSGYDKEWQAVIEAEIAKEKAVDELIEESQVDAEFFESIIADRKADQERANDEKKILDDFRSSTAAYKDALMTKKERLDTELKEKKAQLAVKKQADKDFRRDMGKMAHPINFIARWALRINYRMQQHDNRKETLEKFKKSQKEEREEIEATLRTLDQNAKDIDKSIKKDAPWREAAEQFTSEYQSNTLDEREVHNEWLNEREERREEAERIAEKNRQLDEQFRAREAYEDSFYEQPEEKKSAFRGKSLFSENVQTKGSTNRNSSKQKAQEKTHFLD